MQGALCCTALHCTVLYWTRAAYIIGQSELLHGPDELGNVAKARGTSGFNLRCKHVEFPLPPFGRGVTFVYSHYDGCVAVVQTLHSSCSVSVQEEGDGATCALLMYTQKCGVRHSQSM
jgi:hypothetical protein